MKIFKDTKNLRPIIANIEGNKTMLMPYAIQSIFQSKDINFEAFGNLALEEQVKFCQKTITSHDLEKQAEGILIYDTE